MEKGDMFFVFLGFVPTNKHARGPVNQHGRGFFPVNVVVVT